MRVVLTWGVPQVALYHVRVHVQQLGTRLPASVINEWDPLEILR